MGCLLLYDRRLSGGLRGGLRGRRHDLWCCVGEVHGHTDSGGGLPTAGGGGMRGLSGVIAREGVLDKGVILERGIDESSIDDRRCKVSRLADLGRLRRDEVAHSRPRLTAVDGEHLTDAVRESSWAFRCDHER